MARDGAPAREATCGAHASKDRARPIVALNRANRRRRDGETKARARRDATKRDEANGAVRKRKRKRKRKMRARWRW
jgi:hypothetical protein